VITGLQLTTTATAQSLPGRYVITAAGSTAHNYAITSVNGTLTILPVPLTAVAMAGGAPLVAVYRTSGNRSVLQPYAAGFGEGVRVATGDVNRDGYADVVVAPGPGMAPTVKVYSGVNNSLLSTFNAFGAGERGGVYVAVGDVLGLGYDQI